MHLLVLFFEVLVCLMEMVNWFEEKRIFGELVVEKCRNE